LVLWE